MDSAPIRVALIDDHQVLTEALSVRLAADPELEVVCTAENADEGFREVLEMQPDVVVLDVELPGRGAFDTAHEIQSRLRSTRILFFTGFLSDVFIEQALRIRAHGYLMKGEPLAILAESIKRVAVGERCFSDAVLERLDYDSSNKRYTLRSQSPLSLLTLRQLEVLRYLAKGETVKQVAKSMHLSQKSVDSHKYRIMTKLDIHDRVKLARYAIREGLMLP